VLSRNAGPPVPDKLDSLGYEPLDSSVQEFLDDGWTETDRNFMRRALELARQAEENGEVPVGAVLVCQGAVAGEGWNRPITACDPSAHAEMEALRQAAARLRNYRLPASTLYVTLEPCAMCAGALVLARVERLVFAARDMRFGAVRSKFRLVDSGLLNHRLRVEEGLLAAEAGALLAGFFRERRDP
jgi:tRNA(adenine34) deaminase